jgi:hypothetical protein
MKNALLSKKTPGVMCTAEERGDSLIQEKLQTHFGMFLPESVASKNILMVRQYFCHLVNIFLKKDE